MLTGANASSTIGSGSLVNAMPAKAKPAKSNVVRRLRCGINTARLDEPTAETAQRNLEKANKKSAQRHRWPELLLSRLSSMASPRHLWSIASASGADSSRLVRYRAGSIGPAPARF
jgi:hypothetical protein